MAEPNIGLAFDNMAIQMAGLSAVIGAQGVAYIYIYTYPINN